MIFPGRYVHEPMAVAERLVGKTHLFRTEQKSDPAGSKLLMDQASPLFQRAKGMTYLAAPDRCGSDHQTAIRYGCTDFLVLLGAGEQFRGTDGRPRLPEGKVVGVHDPQAQESEVAHG